MENPLLGKYRNGNYDVEIYSDGTKIRDNHSDSDEFFPEFAESADVTITSKCDGGCEFCYAGCTSTGIHADLFEHPFIDTLHPYTELALNGNDLSHPKLVDFLKFLKRKKVIANITVNQKHFMKRMDLINTLISDELIHGLGISYVKNEDAFFSAIKDIPNLVIHLVAGIASDKTFLSLANRNLKVLILGYKTKGRGTTYLAKEADSINANMQWLKDHLEAISGYYQILSFDNLALAQLDAKTTLKIPEEIWKERFLGDDGDYTFYIDLVSQTFAQSSMEIEAYSMKGFESIDEMFNYIRYMKNKKEEERRNKK